MNAEKVVDKILSQADDQAREIKEQSDQQLRQQDRDFAQQVEQYEQETQQLAQQAKEEQNFRIKAAGRMDASKQYLAEKRAILDEVFDKALEKLRSLDNNQYKELVKKLIKDAVESGDEKVIIDKNETRIDEGFIKQINRELPEGIDGNLQLSEMKRDIGGGVVLEKGKIRKNASLPVLIEQARDQLETELAGMLFEE